MTLRLALWLLAGVLAARADFPSLYAPGCAKDADAARAAKLFQAQCLASLDLDGARKAVLVLKEQRLYLGTMKKGGRPTWTKPLERTPAGTAAGGAVFVGGAGDRFVFRDEVASVVERGSGECGAGAETYVTIARVRSSKPVIEESFLVESCLKPMELASVPRPVRVEADRLTIEWFANGESCEEVRTYNLRAPKLEPVRNTRNCAK